jgi:hypothetical protein
VLRHVVQHPNTGGKFGALSHQVLEFWFSLELSGSSTYLLTKYSCQVRLARESAPSRHINQRHFPCFEEHALRSLYPAFSKILMRGLAGCGPEHSQEVRTTVVRLSCKFIQGQLVV